MATCWQAIHRMYALPLWVLSIVLLLLLGGCRHEQRLSVTKAGNGAGTVTSTPSGINCGTDCSESYKTDTVVTLTATPASGSTLAGWGEACTGTGTCTVTLEQSRSVTATFNLVPRTLGVTKLGTGRGTVTSSPPGIDCGTDCSEKYDDGTVVTLQAVAASGSTFAGWSGDPDCTAGAVTMTANKTCTATFNIQQFVLTVTKVGRGSGMVASTPSGINCGTDCSEKYNTGTVVTLTATPASGSTLAGWGEACTGTGTCTVTLDRDRSVTATFNAVPVIAFATLPERIETNLATFFVSGATQAGNQVTVNGTSLATDDQGNFVRLVPLALGANRL
ncbi:MAG: InlB B-repeat-containing protein, partial [Nitrospinae bacterium]|nr:InlB B-repeat-containing protein [Nitrospinota bacterium]